MFNTLWRQLCFFYVQILPEFKKRFALIEEDIVCWGNNKSENSVKNFPNKA